MNMDSFAQAVIHHPTYVMLGKSEDAASIANIQRDKVRAARALTKAGKHGLADMILDEVEESLHEAEDYFRRYYDSEHPKVEETVFRAVRAVESEAVPA